MFENYIKYATIESRLPLDLRLDKTKAIKYLLYLKELNIDIKNPDMYVLASWCNFDIGSFKKDSEYSQVKSKINLKEELVGDFTVPDGNSYTANGIIVHNCNLPNSATQELVSEVYMKSWELGCKGFTIYRDGCRTGVLISTENKNKSDRPDTIKYAMAPKRPQQLDCDIKKAKIDGEGWTIFVGLLDNKPYEVFGGLSKFVDIPNKHKSGKISKDNGVYNLVIGHGEDQLIIKDISNVFENKTNEAFTRIISLNLRHGVPIHYITEQLTKDKYAEMTSFSRVISRVLKTYIKDGEKASNEKECPSCKMKESLIYQEGCLTCKSCGYSKCN